MTLPATEAAKDHDIREQAIFWYVCQASGCATEQQLYELQQWRQDCAEHERVWQQLTNMQSVLQTKTLPVVSSPVLRSALSAVAAKRMSRREALKVFCGLSVTGAAVLALYQQNWFSTYMADVRTVTGEQRTFHLPDGSVLQLNTRTAVDIAFTDSVRQLTLYEGEIAITTAHDAAARPMLVKTSEAVFRPVGTRFIIRRDNNDSGSYLAVTEGAVEVQPHNGNSTMIHAGQQTWVRRSVEPVTALETDVTDWTEGLIIAQSMPLGQFVKEVARYRTGILQCDPAVAHLRLTGTFPVADTDRILSALEQTLPVKRKQRTRFWVTVVAR